MSGPRSSLDIARNRRARSMITLLESKIKKELEDELGPILTENEKAMIIEREMKSLRKRDSAVKKARLKLLKQKEKALLTWKIRTGQGEEGKKHCSAERAVTASADHAGERKDEVVLEY